MPRRPATDSAAGPAQQLRALETAADCETLAAGLAATAHHRVVARAAELAAERLCYGLEQDLIAAFRRLAAPGQVSDHPPGARSGRRSNRRSAPDRDPGCLAKGAIARALVALDCLDAGLFRDGVRLIQREPVWGGSVDTAADVRASCAMGLAASGDARALIDVVDLLADPEHRARAGAVRAIACTAPLAAEAVLRLKVLVGDAEPEVTGECLRALLAVASETAVPFVADRLGAADPVLAELAALALGESRLDEAVAALRARWEAEPLKRDRERGLLRGAVLARSDAAFDWLLGLIGGADASTAAFVVEALAVYRGNGPLAARLRAEIERRGEDTLMALFEAVWEGAGRRGQDQSK